MPMLIPMTFWAPSSEEITINGGTDVVLTSVTAFTDLPKTADITVNLTGNFLGSTASKYAFDCGDLSTWTKVTILIASGCNLWAKGGAGGAGNSNGGGPGGPALQVNSANSSSILFITNSGAIRGGGGGGGGGARIAASGYRLNTNMSPTCITFNGTYYGGGGGGGSGQTGLNTTGGGITTSTAQCSSATQPGVGGTGTSGGAGGGGARGTGKYQSSGGSVCNCVNRVGVAGGAGGAWGVAGSSGQVAGGAAGKWCDNRDHAYWGGDGTTYGTTSGGFTA